MTTECKHEPDVFTHKTSHAHRSSKCLKCGAPIVSVANSVWMTNNEYRKYITQEIKPELE